MSFLSACLITTLGAFRFIGDDLLGEVLMVADFKAVKFLSLASQICGRVDLSEYLWWSQVLCANIYEDKDDG